jgi:hypothetical protein
MKIIKTKHQVELTRDELKEIVLNTIPQEQLKTIIQAHIESEIKDSKCLEITFKTDKTIMTKAVANVEITPTPEVTT